MGKIARVIGGPGTLHVHVVPTPRPTPAHWPVEDGDEHTVCHFCKRELTSVEQLHERCPGRIADGDD